MWYVLAAALVAAIPVLGKFLDASDAAARRAEQAAQAQLAASRQAYWRATAPPPATSRVA